MSAPTGRYPYDVNLLNMKKALTGYYTLTCNNKGRAVRRVVVLTRSMILTSAALTIDDFGDYASECNNYCLTITSSLSSFYRSIVPTSLPTFPLISEVSITSVTRGDIDNVNITTFRIGYELFYLSTGPIGSPQGGYNGDQLIIAITCADSNLDCAINEGDPTMEETIYQQAKEFSAFNLYDSIVQRGVTGVQTGNSVKSSSKIFPQTWFIVVVALCSFIWALLVLFSIWYIRRRIKRGAALANMRNYTEGNKTVVGTSSNKK